MNDDHPTSGDYAQATASRANDHALNLETRVVYLEHMVDTLIEAVNQLAEKAGIE